MLIERRSGNDRRIVERFSVNINAEWEGLGIRKQGTINDISAEGCFVACSGDIENGSKVHVYLVMKNGMRLPFYGEVVNHVYEIGFGLRFLDLEKEQKVFLERLINSMQKKFKAAAA